MTTARKLLDRLEGVRPRGDSAWMARCPAHQDRHPSLSIRETDIGTVLLHCFAGCATEDVLAAVGFEFSDLYPERLSNRDAPARVDPVHGRDAILAWSVDTTVLLLGLSDWLAGKKLGERDIRDMQRALMDMRELIDEARHVLPR